MNLARSMTLLISASVAMTSTAYVSSDLKRGAVASITATSSLERSRPAFVSTSASRMKMSTTEDAEETTSSADSILSLTLEKPLGMILEEVEEGMPNGVLVGELSDAGSAYASDERDRLVGLKLSTVMGDDVTAMGFDDVMEKIIDAPSPVTIEFELGEEPPQPQYEIGTEVAIKVLQEGEADREIVARVGDNLRKKLLENNVELYRGLKKKLGNCGGGGQCTYCAVDFVDGEGWEERSEYEDSRIGKWPNARLACMNNIQGPATIRIQ
uniref:PDZ domain-containing protein n=1 Tax=Helicotheca tamesis TaxID=374047 RepID=A0A7S2GWY2_9STRA|mmetsp:Transcript_12978/g.17837  ORF Transcript_12978/g.17837 Transcript_12978/m.17837 type:complete len:269 (+) Transcript_12978:83-889(+)|eukprot:CAMPEP_0185723524 /NCGR_PEP_ID=MMETSP1171-20130828/344_1 /TAXON_ID=374046 /ORGANISM="Helicotheca tamensis, Strain CCMP826" /LENGTH=268 /DNA_ID=CAMNT_0028391241 /DNA_START=71 /DNA_END=877 /DNA_ORIENTATION=+